VEWEIELTEECEEWYLSLSDAEAESVAFVVDLLASQGPQLKMPYSSQIKGTRFGQLRELRIQHEGRPYRILYAFDPRRTALLLVGGDKTGDGRWYERMTMRADSLLAEHLGSIG
jgi:hypothetical protein